MPLIYKKHPNVFKGIGTSHRGNQIATTFATSLKYKRFFLG
jgi:hypothetical protein